MVTEEYINDIIFQLAKDNKIPYTEDGMNWLVDKVVELIPETGYQLKVQPLSEMSVQDRQMRKTPKIEIIVK